MQAIDIMTPGVFTAGPEAPISELIHLMLTHSVSSIPIVDGETLVGIVSEGDLMRRAELGSDKRPSRWPELISSRAHLAADYVHTHGRFAREVMTTKVVTVDPSTQVDEIAALLERRRIKRVPVVRDGRVLGIVSHGNLLRALACKIGQQVTVNTAASATRCWWSCARSLGAPRCRRATSSCRTVWCISGATWIPRRNARRGSLRRRTRLASGR
jgi:CBS domain-containing protein